MIVPGRSQRKQRTNRSRRRPVFAARRRWRSHVGTAGLVVGLAAAGFALVEVISDIAVDGTALEDYEHTEHGKRAEVYTGTSP